MANNDLNEFEYDNIFSSTENGDNITVSAWRHQLLFLLDLTKDLDPNTRTIPISKHYDKLEGKLNDDYIEERVDSVKNLIEELNLNVDVVGSPEFPNLDDVMLESKCAGFFESCRSHEITNEDLNMFKTPCANVERFIPPKSSFVEEKIVGTNSILNFLQASKKNKLSVEPAIKNIRTTTPPPEQKQSETQNASEFPFRTAREEFNIQKIKQQNASQFGNHMNNYDRKLSNTTNSNNLIAKKTLGSRRGVRSNFISPAQNLPTITNETANTNPINKKSEIESTNAIPQICSHEKLINVDPKLVEIIQNEIMHKFSPIEWNDIAGLNYAKTVIKEAVVYPMLRPDLFTGLRCPPRGILLFGPPGTGKTLIGKCIASQSQGTFFSITASTLTSKWLGEGEKLVRALFAVAAIHQPSVVFIDEIDSLLSQRSDTEHESSRRLKTEFLTQLDGATTSENDRILIVGATNRPQDLDEAVRRRLVKRLYIPLPEMDSRLEILGNLLKNINHTLDKADFEEIGKLTKGYSGADMKSLCSEASMRPLRSIPMEELRSIEKNDVRAVNMEDFNLAIKNVRPTVSQDGLQEYMNWNRTYGSINTE